MEGSWFEASWGKKFVRPHLNQYLMWRYTLVIPATQEAEIGRLLVPGQPGKKVFKTPSQQRKMVVHTCHPSDSRKHKMGDGSPG
jgi:hypothetical protein